MSNTINIAFTVGDDGKIKLQDAKIQEANFMPLFVTTSNIEGPQYRYRLELRSSPDGEWTETGLAIEQSQNDGEPQVAFVADHFAMGDELKSLADDVADLRVKIRVLADENLALKCSRIKLFDYRKESLGDYEERLKRSR